MKFTEEQVQNSYTQRLANAKRKGLLKAFLLDSILWCYAIFGLTTLYYFFTEGTIQLSNSTFLWMIPAALFMGFVTFEISRSIGRILIFKSDKILKSQEVDAFSWKSTAGVFSIFLFCLTLVLGYVLTEMDPVALFSEQGLLGAQRIFEALVRPNWSIFNMVLNAMVVTIFIAFTATATAIPVAFCLSFMCSRNLMNFSGFARSLYVGLRFVFNFTRSVEPFIWAIIFSVWVGIGPFAGMMALMLHSVASLAKLYSEQIESIDRGPMEAIEATGANRVQVIWYAVVPQVILPFLSYTIYRWDINIRMATVIGLVGGGGVGTLLVQYQGLAKWNEVGTIIVTIAVVVWAMDYLSAKIREAIY